MSALRESIDAAIREAGYALVDEATIIGSPAVFADVPISLHPTVQARIQARFGHLYEHQARAIEYGLTGHDLCMATSTASGKSLVFMSLAADVISRHPGARILALYPARALIQDQITKWKDFAGPMGIRIGFIDGSVPTKERTSILVSCQVILMTPDVLHAWLMSNVGTPEVGQFLQKLTMLVLDEAHVYEGVFGTNMAYLLRRLEHVANVYQVVCSTATLGDPADFMVQLTRRNPRTFGSDDDKSGSSPKQVMVIRREQGNAFEGIVDLVVEITKQAPGKFLAFGDSRKLVEQVVSATRRREHGLESEPDDSSDGEIHEEPEEFGRVLPYRAGYEDDDRYSIQLSLSRGDLAGVVTTSALELGVDIGDIATAVMLAPPPSMKSFWQRAGRAGRKDEGFCVIIDDRNLLSSTAGGLAGYLKQPLEPSWLYLENRFIQFAHALCAATEISATGRTLESSKSFDSLPASFRGYLTNELNPTESVPPDLYPLKQRAQAGPQREFPLRSAMEQDFQVSGPAESRLGSLSLEQSLREAYPGAVYYYMARPFRVFKYGYRDGTIQVRREKYATTQPIAQTMVFPKFNGGILTLQRSSVGLLAETEMQVSQRVTGFVEARGGVKTTHHYGPGSPYSQREINRFFETTGVCWYFPDRVAISEMMGQAVLEAYCVELGVQERDLGSGLFYSLTSPMGQERCQGICVFDSTNGSLRLTERLAEQFDKVIKRAIRISHANHLGSEERALIGLLAYVEDLTPVLDVQGNIVASSGTTDWVTVVVPGQKAMYHAATGLKEVTVLSYRYSPQGMVYDLEPETAGVRWTVPANVIVPYHGSTLLEHYNLTTGETESA